MKLLIKKILSFLLITIFLIGTFPTEMVHAGVFANYETTKNNVPVWSKPYSSETSSGSRKIAVIKEAGSILFVIDSCVNSKGNTFYLVETKTDYGTDYGYVFSGNVKLHTCVAVSSSFPTVNYMSIDLNYHVKTSCFASLCTCNRIVDTTTTSEYEAHNWDSNNQCVYCHVFKPHFHEAVMTGMITTTYEPCSIQGHYKVLTGWKEFCSCGAVLVEERTEKVFEEHVFSDDEICVYCGELKHHHMVNSCSAPFITYTNTGDIAEHIKETSYGAEICSDCGLCLTEASLVKETEVHTFDAGTHIEKNNTVFLVQTCSLCGFSKEVPTFYISRCKGYETERGQLVNSVFQALDEESCCMLEYYQAICTTCQEPVIVENGVSNHPNIARAYIYQITNETKHDFAEVMNESGEVEHVCQICDFNMESYERSYDMHMNQLYILLSAASFIPLPCMQLLDIIDVLLSVANGDNFGLIMSLIGIIPLLGDSIDLIYDVTHVTRVTGSYSELVSLADEGYQSHHIIQDAAVKIIPGYSKNDAPAILLHGSAQEVFSEHYLATSVQFLPGGGTYGQERMIAYKALRKAGVSKWEAKKALKKVDDYFIRELGVTYDTVTRIPLNRKK